LEEAAMNIDDAEKVLSKAMTKYAQQGPEQKKEIQKALGVLLKKLGNATTITSECEKLIQTCLLLIKSCSPCQKPT